MAKIDNFTKEELEEIVKNSSSKKEIARKCGYTSNGNTNKTIMNRLDAYKISTDHLNGKAKQRTFWTIDTIFTEHSEATQATVRRWYEKTNQSKYECSICNLLPYWNGEKLTLTLDHINGINNDNRLENLRWICPNCDRQLSTFGSKNIKNKKDNEKKFFCVDCGDKISRGATRCMPCSLKNRRKVDRPTKDVLKQLLIETNFAEVGRKFGVAGNIIRKWCISYGMSTKAKDYK